jgi:LmbE family N-acetylglucosaminyl deacetylase
MLAPMRRVCRTLAHVGALAVVAVGGASAQRARPSPLALDPYDTNDGVLAADRGAAGLRQRLFELGTFASVMQTTAHPDDEQSGLLTFLSRGTGARTALLTLNRGEAGDNAVGKELFDALGLLRTEELLLADRYYGLDDQYFTRAVDYGFSKTMREAARSWDTTAVLEDMVRIIRQNQPLVVISRWYGGDRDGHGHHQLAGALTPLAVAAAADPTRFPEDVRRPDLHDLHLEHPLDGMLDLELVGVRSHLEHHLIADLVDEGALLGDHRRRDDVVFALHPVTRSLIACSAARVTTNWW